MRGKKILFQGRLVEEESKEFVFGVCKQLAKQAVLKRCCMVFGGGTELELLMAQEIKNESHEQELAVTDYLAWYTAATRIEDERATIGQRYELDELLAHGGYARLRTYLVSIADALVTIGGANGVLDSIEKARLMNKPFFPLPLAGGESRYMWEQYRREDLGFCSREAFLGLGDKNRSPERICRDIFEALHNFWHPRDCKVFIVHGHDGPLKYELKDFIQNTLRLGTPTIVQDEPSGGRTIIEKLEHYAGKANLAFVLMTPDDRLATGEESTEIRWRCRQNVIFELGYFLGRWGRHSAKVFLLYKGRLELPSDMDGIVYIPVHEGIKAAGETIRLELAKWLVD
ncbi:MAG: nucleotide-binding protein [Terriglobia bacterium]